MTPVFEHHAHARVEQGICSAVDGTARGEDLRRYIHHRERLELGLAEQGPCRIAHAVTDKERSPRGGMEAQGQPGKKLHVAQRRAVTARHRIVVGHEPPGQGLAEALATDNYSMSGGDRTSLRY